ncbi:MAG TPA: RDD family protein [Anaerolineae bacterium]|nr:RDD family protein [Anaerolineae bacterium]
MKKEHDLFFEQYTIDTPENVMFHYHVAGIGSRFLGALVDTLILGITLLALSLGLGSLLALFNVDPDIFGGEGEEGSWGVGLVMAIAVAINFLLIWGYYTFFEIVWHGQTPGKRVARTRVILLSGSTADPIAIVIRNLVRIIDWLPWGYFIGVVTMLLNDQSRRLGDFAAGTLVVREQKDETPLEQAAGFNMAVVRRAKALSLDAIQRLHETYPHIDRLTQEEYALVEEALYGPHATTLSPTARPRLVHILSPKVGGPLPDPPGSDIEAKRILQDIATLYYIYHTRAKTNPS